MNKVDTTNKTDATIVWFLLALLFCWLLSKIDTFYVPISDFMNYLKVGRLALIDPLNPLIINPPLYPIIIYLIQTLLPIKQAGVIGGTVFNIACFTCSVYFIWKIIRRWIGWHAVFPVALFVLNPLILYVSLQPTNLPLALLLIAAALYYFKDRSTLAYILIVLASLTRSESFVVFFIFLMSDILITKQRRLPVWAPLCFILLAAWNARPIDPNESLFSEILARRAEIPNITFIRNSFFTAPWSIRLLGAHKPFPSSPGELVITLISVAWVITGVVGYAKLDLSGSVPLLGFFVGYCIIHILFPDRVLRYSYPILPFVYMFMFWPIARITKKIKANTQLLALITTVGLTVSIASLSLINGKKYIENQGRDRAERRLAAEWLNKNVWRPTIVYAFEYYVFYYYLDNKNIIYQITTSGDSWTKDLCQHGETVYVVFDNQTESEGGYFDRLNGLDYFKKLQKLNKTENVLSLVKSIRLEERWADIYKFNKPSDSWCSRLEP